jgi:predicted permease
MGQVAVSLILLVSAGLFLRAMQRAASTPIGFDPTGVSMTTVNLALEGYDEDEGTVFFDRLVERLHGVPGVRSAAFASDLPLDMGASHSGVVPEGWEDRDAPMLSVDYNVVSTEYFETLDILLVSGRAFADTDTREALPVVVVNRILAEQIWPESDPLGKQLRFGSRDASYSTVIGVADDVRNQTLTETPKPFVYVPFAQNYRPAIQIVVRSEAGAAAPASLRAAILQIDPALSLTPILPLKQYTSISILPQRLAAWVTTALGALALLLSGMGIYGVVAHAVTQQSREIGTRMALGAEGGDVVRLIVRRGVLLALPGLLFGGVAALALAQLLRAFLIGLSPTDPVALASGALALVAVVGVASLFPAMRAARIHPMEALRYE